MGPMCTIQRLCQGSPHQHKEGLGALPVVVWFLVADAGWLVGVASQGPNTHTYTQQDTMCTPSGQPYYSLDQTSAR